VGQLELTGLLSAGPVGSSDTFPASTTEVPLQLLAGTTGSYTNCTGANVLTLDSPSSFITLRGVGSGAPVALASLLYLKVDGQVTLRLTNANGGGSPTVQTIPLMGLLVIEFPAGFELTLLEAEGAGRLEYLAAGQS